MKKEYMADTTSTTSHLATTEKTSILRVITYAGAIIAFLIGSGFATGQEIMQYYASYRLCGGRVLPHRSQRAVRETVRSLLPLLRQAPGNLLRLLLDPLRLPQLHGDDLRCRGRVRGVLRTVEVHRRHRAGRRRRTHRVVR